jgi:hypothetical protein
MKTKVASSVGVALCGVLFLTACSGQDSADSQPEEASASEESTAAAGATTAPTEEPTATPEPTVGATSAPEVTDGADPSPQIGDCYTYPTWFSYTTDETVADPVDGCTHWTIAVLDLPADSVSTFPRMQQLREKEDSGTALTKSEMNEQEEFWTWSDPLYDECQVKVREQLGLTEEYAASRYGYDLTGPNEAQWDEGQRWARCNIVLPEIFSEDDELETMSSMPNEAIPACYRDDPGTRELTADPYVCGGQHWAVTHKVPIDILLEERGAYEDGWEARDALVVPACKEISQSMVKENLRPLYDNLISYLIWRPSSSPDSQAAWNSGEAKIWCAVPYRAYEA